MYSIAGRAAATAATNHHAIATLWNPSGGTAITVYTVGYSMTTGSGGLASIFRASARGTPGSTVTPDLDNDYGRKAAPSGAVLDLAAYTVQPTFDTNEIIQLNAENQIGGGAVIQLPVPIVVPPGTGLNIQQTNSSSNVCDVWFEFDEGSTTDNAFYLTSAIDPLAAGESVMGALWNPSSTRAIRLFFMKFNNRGAEAATFDFQYEIRRTTAEGTLSGTNFTAAIENHVSRAEAGIGVKADTSFSTEPTIDASPLFRHYLSGRARIGGFTWTVPKDDDNGIDMDDCIVIPAGSGIACVLTTAAAAALLAKDMTFGWFE